MGGGGTTRDGQGREEVGRVVEVLVEVGRMGGNEERGRKGRGGED